MYIIGGNEMRHEEIDDLWKRYAEGKCNPEEEALIDSWLLDCIDDEDVVPDHKEMLVAGKRIEKGLGIERNTEPQMVN